MQISGETMIFRTEREGHDGVWYTYSTTVSSKRMDGTWASMYVDVRFKKGVVVENKTKIDIKNGFLTVREYTSKNGEVQKRLELMITEFRLPEQEAQIEEQLEQTELGGFSAFSHDEVPF